MAWYSAWRKDRSNKTPPEPGIAENTLMPELEPSQPADEPRPPSAWGWLKHPWLLLIFGSVISLGLWVGIGVWIEHRRELAQIELEETHGLGKWIATGNPRFPIWLPEWLGEQLPDDWQERILIIDAGAWIIDRPPTDHELRLLDRGPPILAIEFRDPHAISDEALLMILERHRLRHLEFSSGRKLTRQHFAALSRQEHLAALHGLQGPFDRSHWDDLAKIKTLNGLSLDGPLAGSASLGSMPNLESVKWDHSQLTDEQFAELAANTKLNSLHLRQTRLTSKSWPVLARMKDLVAVQLESPHIDDATAHSLIDKQPLMEVRLRGGSLSDAGVKELLALPNWYTLEVEGRGLTIATPRLVRSLMPRSNRDLPSGPGFGTSPVRSIVIRGGPPVVDDWLAELAEADLWGLGFVNSAITDKGVEHLKNLPDLEHLILAGTRITDRSMAILSTLQYLRRLDLRNTAITDAGLKQLSIKKKSGVKLILHVDGTHITKEGVEEFLSRHPHVNVYGVADLQYDQTLGYLIPLDEEQMP